MCTVSSSVNFREFKTTHPSGPGPAAQNTRSRTPTMARHGLRTRPPGGDPRAADGENEEDMDGDGRRIPSVPIPHHTYMLPARVLAPCSPLRPCDGSFAHKRAGPVVSATSWSSKLSTPRSHRHHFCIAIARFSVQAGPWIIATQLARNARARRDLCPRL